jgi:glycosyltransferase involved in cell wall biosynthesis
VTVLQLITGRGPTGAAAAALADARALASAGVRVVVASADEPGISDACREQGLEWRGGLKLGRGATRLIHVPRDLRRLRALGKELDVRVVHTHRTDDQLLAAAALRGHIRHVRTWHRHPGETSRTLMQRVAPLAHGYVCVAREHASTLKDLGAKHAEYIPLATDVVLFKPGRRGETGPLELAHVGRWKRDAKDRDRGQRAALRVFKALQDSPGWHGALIGRGEMGPALRAEAYETLALDPRRVDVREIPQNSAEAFAEVLGALHVGLVFTQGSDGTSRAAAELLACGVPLCVADLPGLREFAEDGAGVALPPGDTAAWANQLRAWIDDHSAWTTFSKNARAAAESRHTLRGRGLALQKFYALL